MVTSRIRSSTLLAVGGLVVAGWCAAVEPRDELPRAGAVRQEAATPPAGSKDIDEPEPVARRQRRERLHLLEALPADGTAQAAAPVAEVLAKTGVDRVLIILVEFGGTDTLTWTAGSSTWDPLGRADPAEVVYDAQGNPVFGDCSRIITQTRQFTYSGPLHNQIERPRTADDPSGWDIWVPDFDRSYYEDLSFGNGVVLDYDRQDGSHVSESFLGQSVRDYFEDLSSSSYSITGDVLGWIRIPHSVYWYGADQCPGRKSLPNPKSIPSSGAIPGAGTHRSFVIDTLEAAKTAYPDLDWAHYDQDHNGVIDRLWIIHAGLGEEADATVLNRTSYGEGGLWSHSSQLSPPHEVVPGVRVEPYILMPENSGISVLAHEFGHSLGADDLYSYAGGGTSAGFWTLMADSWTGHPLGMSASSMDPWHLDGWGWLHPRVITDPTREHVVTLGQASRFAGGDGVARAAKIRLPDQVVPLPVTPNGSFHWWGGDESLLNATMTVRQPIAIPAAGATLSFSLAYDIEQWWDFLWVQASADGGVTWSTLSNSGTVCGHATNWIGSRYGFPADLCAAGIGGFTGRSPDYPRRTIQSFSLASLAGRSILLRLWYMTDTATQGQGVFVDDVQVSAGGVVLLGDDAESGPGRWAYADGWDRYRTNRLATHSLYLQWRNTSASGGYDSNLGDPRWRFGPVPSGLLVWYNNNRYTDNEIPHYLTDPPGFGPKGRMLLFDAHPEPYRDTALLGFGFDNEGGNLAHRGQMRDAPYSLRPTPDFAVGGQQYPGRPGVARFDDALSTYPGAEYVSAGPGYSPPRWLWITRQWDASVVPPSRQPVGIRAPGLGAADLLSYNCSAQTDGTLRCRSLSDGLGYAGGSGNPGDVAGAYGWHAEILAESDSQATVRIWNTGQYCRIVCEPGVPERALVGLDVFLAVEVTATGCDQPVLYEWELGDGSPRLTEAAPRHVFGQAGRFAWKLLASSGGSSCSSSGWIEVFPPPSSRVRRHLVTPPRP